MGQIKSLAPEENFPADSFFDIFTELDTNSGTLHTQDPTHMTATINSVPPAAGTTYLGPGTTVPLYNSSGTQVGTLQVIDHEIHSSIICPCECEPYIRIRPNKTMLDVGIPLGNPAVVYDVVRGTVSATGPNWAASFLGAACQSPDGAGSINDGVSPLVNQLRWYASKDSAFSQYYGTYNACPITYQVGNRDTEVPAGTCP